MCKMHIKSIHLDGFKSYQKSTDIIGFTSQFNAITGYNGSGKSNVLDSICFILGINKLDNIRAKSMSELITHGGTKAIVSIRFDNTDKKTSPYNFEQHDEITIQRTITAQATGKGCTTSYTLNGHAATNTRIQDFFRGIGLNVNNPHFLIMQGRITTVLNMKPEEILGMVEEAAGTKMYDQKKKEAEKTLNQKDAKLKEIQQIFEGSIDPRMEKFREDRRNMVEVTRLGKLKENATRKLEAFMFFTLTETIKYSVESIENCKKEIEDLQGKIVRNEKLLEEKQKEREDIEHKRNNHDAVAAIEEEKHASHAAFLSAEQGRNAVNELINKTKNDIGRIENSLAKDRKVLEAKRQELEKTKSANSNDINSHKQNEELVEKLRDELEALTRGTVANEKGEHVSVETMIQDSKSSAAQLEAEIRTMGNRLDRLQKSAVDLEKQVKEEDGKIDKKALIDYKDKHGALQNKMSELNFDYAENERIRNRHKEITDRCAELEVEMNRTLARINSGRYSMTYTPPPVSVFNAKTDVIGLLAHVMKIRPGCENYGAAIDVAAGGLYQNVVVKSQEIARILIDSKAFSGRRTMIPVEENDRANPTSKPLSASAMAAANEIAARYNEKLVKYIDLITFPDMIDNTFIAAFGHILVVETLDCAKDIAYHDRVKTRVLTRRGDDVKPNGLMSGGHNESGEKSVLVEFEPYHVLKDEFDSYTEEIKTLDEMIEDSNPKWTKYNELDTNSKNILSKIKQLERHLENSRYGLVLNEYKVVLGNMERLNKEIADKSEALKILEAKVKELESKKTNDKGSQEKRKKELTSQLQAAEKATFSNKDKAEKARRAVLQLQAAVDDLINSIQKEEASLENKKKELEDAQARLPILQEQLDDANKKKAEIKAKDAAHANEQRKMVVNLGKASKELDLLRKEDHKMKALIDEKNASIKKHEETEKTGRKDAQAMMRKHEWLEEEQGHFNKQGGLYEFQQYSSRKGQEEIKDLSDKIEKIERSLCMKNISNLDSCEARVFDIKGKRDRLLDDFEMLRKTIAVLDKKKVDELMRAHESVNRDFGVIFNCLLPDATAKLVPPEGKSVVDGLEVRVAFNGVEKDSLHELSGGQRSLVALSLILAMLKFKPAPLYILDEVDAALDLSHTANIGMMIKTHFRDHQFIIVSLKQGMFSNADSLFQTSFVDGHSTCKLLTGDALLKAKNDTKLAEQAAEMADPAKADKKKKPQKKPARSDDE